MVGKPTGAIGGANQSPMHPRQWQVFERIEQRLHHRLHAGGLSESIAAASTGNRIASRKQGSSVQGIGDLAGASTSDRKGLLRCLGLLGDERGPCVRGDVQLVLGWRRKHGTHDAIASETEIVEGHGIETASQQAAGGMGNRGVGEHWRHEGSPRGGALHHGGSVIDPSPWAGRGAASEAHGERSHSGPSTADRSVKSRPRHDRTVTAGFGAGDGRDGTVGLCVALDPICLRWESPRSMAGDKPGSAYFLLPSADALIRTVDRTRLDRVMAGLRSPG